MDVRLVLLTPIGLFFWFMSGVAVTKWYDRKGFHGADPELLECLHAPVRSRQDHSTQAAGAPG